MKSLIVKSLLLMSVFGLVACGGSNKLHNDTSNNVSSSVASSSVAAATVMEVGKEYPFTAETKITNTGTTNLLVTKKYYWESQKTVVVLQEGSATIK